MPFAGRERGGLLFFPFLLSFEVMKEEQPRRVEEIEFEKQCKSR